MNREHHQQDQDSFYSDLLQEDELGATIRAHLYIESTLDKLIETLTEDYEHVIKMQLDFAQKVNLSVAIGLPREYAPALLAIGKIRNKFAHRLDTKINKSMMNDFYKQFSPEQKLTIHRTFKNTLNTTSLSARSLSELPPKDQFAVLSVALRLQLIAITKLNPIASSPQKNENSKNL